MDKTDFLTPPNHINFLAKKLFENCGEILDGSIAYLDANGGGPIELHTHDGHDHLFIVVKGEAKVFLNDEKLVVPADNHIIVKGSIPHSVWNNISETTIVVGITLRST